MNTPDNPYAPPWSPPSVPVSAQRQPVRPPGVETREVLLVLGAGCLIAALAAGTALVWRSLGANGQAALMMSVTAALLVAAPRLRRLPATADAVCAVGVAGLLIDAVAARSLGLAGVRAWPLHVYAGVAATVVAGVLVLMSRLVPSLWAPPLGAALACGAGVVGWVDPTSIDRLAWLGPAAIAVAVVFDLAVRHVATATAGRIANASVAIMLGTIGAAASLVSAERHTPAALAAVATAALLLALPELTSQPARDVARAGSLAGGSLLGLLAVAELLTAQPDARAVILIAAAITGVVATYLRVSLTERVALPALSLASVVVAGLYATLAVAPRGFVHATLGLAAVAGAVALVWPRHEVHAAVVRAGAAVSSVVLATIGVDGQLRLDHVMTPEAYVAMPALGWLVVAAVVMAGDRAMSSWVLAPGLVLGLLPSFAGALGGDGTRQVVVLAAGAALVIVGAQLRLAAPLAIGAGAVSVIVVRLVGPQLSRLPHWVALGIVGAVLLTLGATWEARVLDVRRAAHSMRPRIAALR